MSSDSPDAAPSLAAAAQPRHRVAVTDGPEKRLLDGVRTWTDVFPWLRLVRVCRVAGAPVWITHMLIVAILWWVGMDWLGSGALSANLERDVVPSGSPPLAGTARTLADAARASDAWTALRLSRVSLLLDWRMMLWSMLVWMPSVMALLRVGALLTAGRDMPSYARTWRAVFGRLPGALVIVLLPTIVATFFGLIAWMGTWLAGMIGGVHEYSTWATWLSLTIVLPATLIAGLLIFAGKFAVPLGLTAIMIEPDADPIDALSRGYEYTLRRLPQLVLLMLIATLISVVLVVAWAGIALAGRGVALFVTPINPPLLSCLAILPSVIAVMLLWSMLGGIYLLLRQSAGGQEIEDLAIEPDHWISPKMPSVQNR